MPSEHPDYLSKQLLTYLGNKRALLPLIAKGMEQVRSALGGERFTFLDLFSGSGIVSRYVRQHARHIIANDLEQYSAVINRCYLANNAEVEAAGLPAYLHELNAFMQAHWQTGFLTELYAPADDAAIQPEERVFYARRNAIYLDTARRAIATLPEAIQPFFLAPLLAAASVHANTSGVFKGFYKNHQGVGQFGGHGRHALSRILADIRLELPVTSAFTCSHEVMQMDANALVRSMEPVDVAYFDPPYNQHPYGSNYFMLNLLATYQRPETISPVSGIPKDWNRSAYNTPLNAEASLFDAVAHCPAKFILISYNSEGFIPHDTFVRRLAECGRVSVLESPYNSFRASRNLGGRALYVTEYLYILDKR
jgi:adenine-specific DNA-methyltransferase